MPAFCAESVRGFPCPACAWPARSRDEPTGVGAEVVVAEHRSIHDPDLGGSYTVKVYSSTKVFDDDGSWKHVEIELRPDSDRAEFLPITITSADEEEFRVVAEFLTVLR